MKRLLVLGGGTAGTMVVNKLRRRLPRAMWDITVVDHSDRHYYQPGYLFLPFDAHAPDELHQPTARRIPDGVTLLNGQIDRVMADRNLMVLTPSVAVRLSRHRHRFWSLCR